MTIQYITPFRYNTGTWRQCADAR